MMRVVDTSYLRRSLITEMSDQRSRSKIISSQQKWELDTEGDYKGLESYGTVEGQDIELDFSK